MEAFRTRGMLQTVRLTTHLRQSVLKETSILTHIQIIFLIMNQNYQLVATVIKRSRNQPPFRLLSHHQKMIILLLVKCSVESCHLRIPMNAQGTCQMTREAWHHLVTVRCQGALQAVKRTNITSTLLGE